MNLKLKNKIEAADTSINKLLKEQKFTIDYFQREYRWQEEHIKTLIDDLTMAFSKSFSWDHKRADVANYENYYLGPVVFSINPDSGKKSIIDGQQRITSITLLLIYLNHLQANSANKVNISELIYSERYGEKSFNMSDESREECLMALFETGKYDLKESDDESIKNMLDRYSDISECFPDEFNEEVLPFFIDWLNENVTIVEITAYSDDNAYTIFETMNDRGLNLTPTEMLKGFILSKLPDRDKRNEINDLWKDEIQKLHKYGESADQSFFQAWFRGKYATSIRPGKAGSENRDFEQIGSRYHNWFKDSHQEKFGLNSPDDIYKFFKFQFPFFVKWYIEYLERQVKFAKDTPHLYYIKNWGIAESLQEPLILAPIIFGDDENTILKKMDYVARYIETFTVRRSINYRKFSQTSIKYTIFGIIKYIRDNNLSELNEHLTNKIEDLEENWSGVLNFGLHGMNRKFVKHLLSRISGYVDNIVGKGTNYVSYFHPSGKQFEIEHIWGNKFDEHKDEFEQENEFQEFRNNIGALILLPQGTNQSFSSDKYEDKLLHYIKENTYAQTLNPAFYSKNPNFLNSETAQQIGFKPYIQFKKEDIRDRQKLVQKLCENIWGIDYFIE